MPERIVAALGLNKPVLGVVRDGDEAGKGSRDGVFVVFVVELVGAIVNKFCLRLF